MHVGMFCVLACVCKGRCVCRHTLLLHVYLHLCCAQQANAARVKIPAISKEGRAREMKEKEARRKAERKGEREKELVAWREKRSKKDTKKKVGRRRCLEEALVSMCMHTCKCLYVFFP